MDDEHRREGWPARTGGGRGEGRSAGGADGSTKGKNEINDKRDAGLTNKQINTWEGPIGK